MRLSALAVLVSYVGLLPLGSVLLGSYGFSGLSSNGGSIAVDENI